MIKIIYKIIKMPYCVIRDLVLLVVINCPGRTGYELRKIYYKVKFKKCGKNLKIDIGVQIDCPELITVGDDVFIDKYCIISTGKNLQGNIKRIKNVKFEYKESEIVIGDEVHICQFSIIMGYGGIKIDDKVVLSSGCKIYSLTNTAYDIDKPENIISLMPYAKSIFILSPIVLNRNVWLGLNVIGMPGVVVGRDSFAKSNSILMGEFPDNSYIEGSPARKTRNRFIEIGE